MQIVNPFTAEETWELEELLAIKEPTPEQRARLIVLLRVLYVKARSILPPVVLRFESDFSKVDLAALEKGEHVGLVTYGGATSYIGRRLDPYTRDGVIIDPSPPLSVGPREIAEEMIEDAKKQITRAWETEVRQAKHDADYLKHPQQRAEYEAQVLESRRRLFRGDVSSYVRIIPYEDLFAYPKISALPSFDSRLWDGEIRAHVENELSAFSCPYWVYRAFLTANAKAAAQEDGRPIARDYRDPKDLLATMLLARARVLANRKGMQLGQIAAWWRDRGVDHPKMGPRPAPPPAPERPEQPYLSKRARRALADVIVDAVTQLQMNKGKEDDQRSKEASE